MINKISIKSIKSEQNFGSVLKAYLELNDYAVDWVEDGKFAIKHYSENEYDICVLDVMLPNIDGFTIAENIRKLNTDVSLIFLTAKSLKQDILKGYGLGADDYITKPFATYYPANNYIPCWVLVASTQFFLKFLEI